MNIFKKTVSLFLAFLFVFTSVLFVFAEETKKDNSAETAEAEVIEIETETNKNKYGTSSTAKITVTVTNTGDKPLFNVRAQAIFNDLLPVSKKSSTTSKSAECLQPGDSFTFSYKVIINVDEFDINIFSKLALIFKEFFKGAYHLESSDYTGKEITIKKQTDKITFGKTKAENLVEVAYSTKEKAAKKKPENKTETNAENKNSSGSVLTTTTEPTTEKQTTRPYTEPKPTESRTTEYRYTEPRTTKPRPTEHRTTEHRYTEPRTTEHRYTKPETTYPQYSTPSYEERAYSKYIEFIRANSSSIRQCDAADINGDDVFDLIIENFNGDAAAYTFNDQYGIYELYSAPMNKGYNMEVYYSVINSMVIFPSANTGGSTYTTVKFSNTNAYITDEIEYSHDSGYLNNGSSISEAEYDSIVNSYANQYYNVDGTPSQLIGTLQGIIDKL